MQTEIIVIFGFFLGIIIVLLVWLQIQRKIFKNMESRMIFNFKKYMKEFDSLKEKLEELKEDKNA